MKKILFILVIILCGKGLAQNMNQSAFNSLFSDQKANKVGDAITILVVESTQASNDAQTSAGRGDNFGLTGSTGSVVGTGLNANIGTSSDFKGSGSTSTSGMISTKISATVDSVLPNGNLIISGNKKIVINGETQTVLIKGMVRATDIAPDNSVYSYNIANAEIQFQGDGLINSSQHPGIITKFLHMLF
jgi:flagellar L-ring protein precursor FlgH